MTNLSSPKRRYLALWFPYLPADRLRRTTCGLAPEAPIAFVEKVKAALRLVAIDPAAHALGIEPGMTLADARARVPELQAVGRDEAGDRSWLKRMADGCIRYTPMVALDEPDGVILDVTGCTHLFGGEAGMGKDIEARMARLQMAVRLAFADTAAAAHALARHQILPFPNEATAIRQLPVTALELDPEATQGLLRAGLKTIGELAKRPKTAIAARFGAGAVDALRNLLGEASKPIRPWIPVAPILVERRFPEPIILAEHAIAKLSELAVEAARLLEERAEGGRRFEALFFRSDGLVRPLAIETSLPSRDPDLIIRLMNERIENLNDPLDPGFGFDLVRLSVPITEPLATSQLGFQDPAARESEVAALIDRLSISLGRSRVRRLMPRDTHIPERMQFELPAIETRHSKIDWPKPVEGEPPMRPLHLFDPPQPIEVIAEVPDGPPRRFRWRSKFHEVRRFEGPERIASEWWKRRDGAISKSGLTRDYYRVEDARGQRFWVFRHGLFGESPDPGWYLHGLLA